MGQVTVGTGIQMIGNNEAYKGARTDLEEKKRLD